MLDAAIDAYVQSLAAERGMSPHTVAAYGRDCAAFAAYLETRSIRRIEEILPGHITGHLEALQKQGLAARSRARSNWSLVRSARVLGCRATGGGRPDSTAGRSRRSAWLMSQRNERVSARPSSSTRTSSTRAPTRVHQAACTLCRPSEV